MARKLSWLSLAVLALGLALASAGGAAEKPGQAKQTKALVQAAVKLIKAQGEGAFAELRRKDSRWYKDQMYLFVGDDKGLELVNPAFPELEGKNLWDHKDPTGKLVVQEEWKIIKAKGAGWLECLWAKPGTDTPTRCRTYVQGVKVNGKLLMVGATYYLE